jgi:metal-responsive CopG/Arc/MetJ family transcriptional regulator
MSMMRVSANLNKERVKQFDSFIIAPVSRSQVIDAIIEYTLKSPEFLKAIVNNEQDKINRLIEIN